jgi:cyclohexa-1,5-dienecarbonyl-CoA hydratase
MTEHKDDFVTTSVSDGVARTTLKRPPANVLHIPMLEQMDTALAELAQDQTVKVMILQAEGKLFSAGVDVADHTPERVGEMIPLFNRVCRALAEFPSPTVAAIQGHALGGGCELVICSDFAIMIQGARIGQPEIRLAAMAPIAALRLPMLVGPRWAANLLFTGAQIQAQQALEIGLVDLVVPAESLEQKVDEFVSGMTGLSSVALRLNKRGYLLGMAGWEEGLEEMERMYLEDLMSSEDAMEGLQAFQEKREPIWRDR